MLSPLVRVSKRTDRRILYLRELKNAIGERQAGYEDEPWGFDSEASVIAASGVGA